MPQVQAPAVHAEVEKESHTSHVPPPLPHALNEVPGWQVLVLPSQQPVGQLVESQMHWLPLQRWPGAHAGPLPQPQPPSVPHALVRGLVEQLAHMPPPAPHAVVVVGLTHVVPEQHPPGQLVESQMHAPPLHRWPAPHAAFPPHLQTPPVHWLAFAGSHATHATPLRPHAPGVGAVQAPLEQQPLPHEAMSQPVHAWFTQL